MKSSIAYCGKAVGSSTCHRLPAHKTECKVFVKGNGFARPAKTAKRKVAKVASVKQASSLVTVTIAQCEADRAANPFGHGSEDCPLGITHDVRRVAASMKSVKRGGYHASGKPSLARPSIA